MEKERVDSLLRELDIVASFLATLAGRNADAALRCIDIVRRAQKALRTIKKEAK